MRTKQAVGALSLLVGVLAGCAGPPASPAAANASATQPIPTLSRPTGPTSQPTGSTSQPIGPPAQPTGPSSRPTGPPDNPTDQLKPIGWVVGTVTSGGSGPCYGLTADGGTRYALHSTAGITLVKGARVQVLVKPALVRIYCGPGKLVELAAARPLT